MMILTTVIGKICPKIRSYQKGTLMKKRILTYRKRIDALLAQGADCDWSAVLEEHLTQITFFQHERLIHLIVTMTFAVLTMLSACFLLLTQEIALCFLTLLLLALLIPYIAHYYTLENEVQRMYGQYDEILRKISASHTVSNISAQD